MYVLATGTLPYTTQTLLGKHIIKMNPKAFQNGLDMIKTC